MRIWDLSVSGIKIRFLQLILTCLRPSLLVVTVCVVGSMLTCFASRIVSLESISVIGALESASTWAIWRPGLCSTVYVLSLSFWSHLNSLDFESLTLESLWSAELSVTSLNGRHSRYVRKWSIESTTARLELSCCLSTLCNTELAGEVVNWLAILDQYGTDSNWWGVSVELDWWIGIELAFCCFVSQHVFNLGFRSLLLRTPSKQFVLTGLESDRFVNRWEIRHILSEVWCQTVELLDFFLVCRVWKVKYDLQFSQRGWIVCETRLWVANDSGHIYTLVLHLKLTLFKSELKTNTSSLLERLLKSVARVALLLCYNWLLAVSNRNTLVCMGKGSELHCIVQCVAMLWHWMGMWDNRMGVGT